MTICMWINIKCNIFKGLSFLFHENSKWVHWLGYIKRRDTELQLFSRCTSHIHLSVFSVTGSVHILDTSFPQSSACESRPCTLYRERQCQHRMAFVCFMKTDTMKQFETLLSWNFCCCLFCAYVIRLFYYPPPTVIFIPSELGLSLLSTLISCHCCLLAPILQYQSYILHVISICLSSPGHRRHMSLWKGKMMSFSLQNSQIKPRARQSCVKGRWRGVIPQW